MTEVTLTQGKVAVIDDADAPLAGRYKWFANRHGALWYCVTKVKGQKILLHRLLLGLKPGDPDVDHVNRDGLDNRRKNLRIATRSQNNANSIGQPSRRKSQYKGVSWNKNPKGKVGGYWRAKLGVNGRTIRNNAPSEIDAAKKYNELAKQHYGDFARVSAIG